MKLTTDRPLTLFDLVMEKLKPGSKNRGKQIVQYSLIELNGTATNDPRTLVNPGDVVTLERNQTPVRKIKPPFPILYEDEHLLVAEKPPGILTHGVGESNWKSFFGMLAAYINEMTKEREHLFIVHRLDKEVTGLLIFAKSLEIQEYFKTHWKTVEKLYCALVEHAPPQPEGTLESWLHEHPKSLKVSSGPQRPFAKFAVTHYRTLSQEGDYTLLEIKLDTGRKNQIRVQLSDMGCPIVGDFRYGADDTVKRQIRLCAYSLTFPHPVTGKVISLQIKLPKSFLNPSSVDEYYK
ncbi:RluA family pseudouridine synthase [Myxococcota bacterium]|nr:RluA family pseudouridine synthase [Myxococcota bacterium]